MVVIIYCADINININFTCMRWDRETVQEGKVGLWFPVRVWCWCVCVEGKVLGRACSTVAPKCWRGGEDKSCLMFMFRRRRRGLIKRLLLARLGYDASGAPGVLVDVSGDGSSEEPGRLLLKGLDEPQLQLLVDAVDGGGKQPSDCVLLPYRHQASTNSTPAHVLCCQMWRWPDLVRADELKRLPVCGSANDPVYTCCNPYHWSRLCEPGLSNIYFTLNVKNLASFQVTELVLAMK